MAQVPNPNPEPLNPEPGAQGMYRARLDLAEPIYRLRTSASSLATPDMYEEDEVLAEIVNRDEVKKFFDSVVWLAVFMGEGNLYLMEYSEEPLFPQSGSIYLWRIPLEKIGQDE